MRAYTESQRDQWELFLPVFEFAMNNAISSITGITPFFANFGRHPHTADSLLVARSSSSKHPTAFNQGDRVYLSKKRGRGHLSKQEALYSGPYPIRKKLGKSTYVLGGTPSAVPALQNV